MLSLSHILSSNHVDISFITETDLPTEDAMTFAIDDYTTFTPIVSPTSKTRLIALVKKELAVHTHAKLREDLMTVPGLSIWLELCLAKNKRILLAGVYRPWSGLKQERLELEGLIGQIEAGSLDCKKVIILGDFNLDSLRVNDPSYGRAAMLDRLHEAVALAGLESHPTGPTWRSHGLFNGTHRTSCIDHAYTAGVEAKVEVLSDATTDHRPLLVRLTEPGLDPRHQSRVAILRRNVKAMNRTDLEAALDSWSW